MNLIQELLGLFERKKTTKVVKKDDWIEIARAKPGALSPSFNPKLEPLAMKLKDLECAFLSDIIEGTPGFLPVFEDNPTDPCGREKLVDSLISQDVTLGKLNFSLTGAMQDLDTLGVTQRSFILGGASLLPNEDNQVLDQFAKNNLVFGKKNRSTKDEVTVGGYGNLVEGFGAFVMGKDNNVGTGDTAHWGFTTGQLNTVTADNAIVAGAQNTVSGLSSLVYGRGNSVDGVESLVGGDLNTIAASASSSIAIGSSNELNASNTTAIGNDNQIYSSGAIALGGENVVSFAPKAFVHGLQNEVSNSSLAFVHGQENIIEANDLPIVMLGSFNEANDPAGNLYVMGSGNVCDQVDDVYIIGKENTFAEVDDSTAIGFSNTLATGISDVHIIGTSNTSNASNSVAIGHNNQVNDSLDVNSYLFGKNLQSGFSNGNIVVIGHYNVGAYDDSTRVVLAVGDSTTAYNSIELTTRTDAQSGMFFKSLYNTVSYADDAAAAAGGVDVGFVYRNGSEIRIRMV